MPRYDLVLFPGRPVASRSKKAKVPIGRSASSPLIYSFILSLRAFAISLLALKKKGSLDKIQHLEMRCGCNDSYVILFLTSFAPSDMAPMCKRCTLINSHHNPMTIKSRVKSSMINSLFPFRDTWGATAVTKFTASPGKIVRVCRAD